MIREPKDPESLKINVTLKDGTQFQRMDTTVSPLGQHERIVAFWLNNNTVRIYPLNEVSFVEFVFEN